MFTRRTAARGFGLRKRPTVLVLVAALGAAVLVTADRPATPEAPPPALTEAPTSALAMNAAQRQGTPVEALDQRTEKRTVFAQPDGTFTADLHVTPQRVRKGDGWVAPDPALERSDAGITPKGTVPELALSRGGTGAPLVRMARDGHEYTLTWPGALPEPHLDGATATYADVLPDVDLKITTTVTGYAQHIVVRTPEAAANPALQRIRFDLRTKNLLLKAHDDGRLTATSPSGETIFEAASSWMWDSAKRETDSPLEGRSPVGVEITEDSLALVPDAAALADPHAVFPLVIDPSWHTPDKQSWTSVYDDGTDAMRRGTHWNGANSQAETAWWLSGITTARSGKAYSQKLVVRSYFQFDTGFLAGRQVLSSKFITSVVYGPTACGTSETQALYDAGTIYSDTNWYNQPAGGHLQNVSVPSVYSGCTGFQEVGFDKAAGGTNAGGVSTFFLTAASETTDNAWRKYHPDHTKLSVNYNHQPGNAYEVRTDRDMTPCHWCAGVTYLSGPEVTLHARLSDPDDSTLFPMWEVTRNGVTVPYNGASNNSGAPFTSTLDLTGKHDQTVSWRVKANDGNWESPDWVNGPSFKVDVVPPKNPPLVVSPLYPEDNRWHGGASVPGAFTFTAKDDDVDHFAYGWDGAMTETAHPDKLGLDGQAVVPLTPPGDGPQDLHVRSVDRAGNPGPTRIYHFYVRGGTGPLAQYAFDGDTKDSAFLGWRDATAHGGPSYVPGALGSALRFDGTGKSVSAPNAVRTDASFSVSAWVRLEDDAHSAVVLSQESTRGYPDLVLWYQVESRKWAFGMPRADLAGTDVVVSAASPVVGSWTKLTGVFDASTRQLKLYVDGEPAETTSRTGLDWHGGGNLRVGYSLWGGNDVQSPFRGSVDEVALYDRVVSDAEVKAGIRADNVQLGHWRFDQRAPSVNEVSGGPAVVLSPGVSATTTDIALKTGDKPAALHFPGAGEARSDGPVLRTDRDFTVAGWVKVPSAAPADTTYTVVSQDGTASSGFEVFLRNGQWHFGVRAADGAAGWNALATTTGGAGTDWTHLTATFDASTRTARLFVDGTGDGEAVGLDTLWDATGDLVFGRSHGGNHLNGFVDDWRAYSRVLAPEEIQGIVAQDGVTAGTWKLDTNAVEASLPARDGKLNGDVTWTPGQSSLPNPADQAARLSGAGHVSAPQTIDTRRSFSVTAWAKVDRVGSAMSVVSLEGRAVGAFDLRTTDDGRWAFTMARLDHGSTTRDHAYGGPVQVGVWTHLAAGYDRSTGRMSLYVNGVAAGSAPHLGAWSPDPATGSLRIGRTLQGTTAVQHFSGAIDDVSVYSRPLFVDEVRRLAGRDLALVHEWRLDEPSGTSAADSVGVRSATLTGGATHAPGRLGSALAFDGAGAATTQGVDLRTDESFTVSAWVYLPTGRTCEFTEDVQSCEWVALSVDGQHTSKFRLGHLINDDGHRDGKWFFEMPEGDAVDAVVTKAAVTTAASEVDTWVHLTGVYDAKHKKIWIYVNGTRIGDGTLNTPWHTTGALVLGRGKVGGTPAQHWVGSVDEVRLYTGPLTDDRVSTLHGSYPEENATPTMPTPTGHWKFNENTGTTAADGVGGRTATLKNGAGWIAGRTGHAAWLDGVDDHAETAGPVLLTEPGKSFTVAAWAYLHGSGSTGYRTVVAEDGDQVSSFRLGYDAATDRWTGVVPKADSDGAETSVVRSSTPAAKSNWTHLALSYDAGSGHLKLHVNGVPSGTVVGATAIRSTGPLTVGRMKAGGGPAGFFPRGVDDLRVYDRALSDGELKLVSADVTAVASGMWRFDDDTVRDHSQRNNPTAAKGPVSFTDGVNGRALKLDGTSYATTTEWGASMRDSFTVSAWARLEARDAVATVVGQDGSVVSGFVLQYRPEADRWVFGGPTQDTEQAPLVWAASAQPPKTNSWTHLTGVYDRPNGRLRLYVDGKLAGIRDGVALPETLAPLTIGAGKVAGKPGNFFRGSIDEVRTELGVQTEAVIAGRGGYAAPAAGQLGVLVNGSGDHATGSTTGPLREGYHLLSTLGTLVDPAHANTRPLYSCLFHDDVFTSLLADCEGQTVLGVIGAVYRVAPSNVPTIPIYRCAGAGDHFESRRSDCAGARVEGLLGHTVAYAALTRNFNRDTGDHAVTVEGTPAGYRSEGPLGFLSLVAKSGTHQLMSCHDGYDQFVSTSATCDGKTVSGGLGWAWTQPPADVATRPLYRCRTSAGQAFASLEPTCEGLTADGLLGHVQMAVPTTQPVFPA
ncbi:concanavalin A-like lectin/glucanase superfamily protein [Saccharothrix saharensis]|uniref:Concanavalin A-like lectin/glucanase superfamily protein n=1 Tax=Saccharothrix saharensis TaxID=571190 RepID=A0A543JEH5_9PSEU|nr:LamG domain-containing protein [Saccharothrix saharensis]TQM81258.1 concanavalin A-like lectin/glucanase superfamily protein [Saccharothrix saharensis]